MTPHLKLSWFASCFEEAICHVGVVCFLFLFLINLFIYGCVGSSFLCKGFL